MQPSLYQIVHCHHNRPRFVAEHHALLTRSAERLWGVKPAMTAAQLTSAIEQLLQRERYSQAVSAFVRVDLMSDGAVQLTPLGSSLYEGYALRSLRPECCTLRYELPFAEPCSTAAEACHALAEEVARSSGFEAAVRCDATGVLRSLGDAHLFAGHGGALYTSETPTSVEGRLLIKAAERLHLRCYVQPLTAEKINRYEELFAVDYRGITALARCDEHPLMTLRADRLAEEMEALVTAR